MTRAVIRHLTLTDFRSYDRAELALDGRSVFLFGPNGAGKTNLLEAISLLSPGRGLRGASIAELGRRAPGEAQGRAWSVSVLLETPDGEARLGTGVESPGAARRVVRIDGEPVPPARLSDHLRLVWLTPAQDRLFLEGASERRRFLDRLVFAAEPSHATHAATYDKAMRERTRLLGEPPADPAWLSALEARMAEAGAVIAEARAPHRPGPSGRDRRPRGPALPPGVARAHRPLGTARRDRSGPVRDRGPAGRSAAGIARSRRGGGPGFGRPAPGRYRGDPSSARSSGGGMFHRRAEGADSEPGAGPGGAAFACRISAKHYIVARRSGRAPGRLPARRSLRRNRGPGTSGVSDRRGRSAVRGPQGPRPGRAGASRRIQRFGSDMTDETEITPGGDELRRRIHQGSEGVGRSSEEAGDVYRGYR